MADLLQKENFLLPITALALAQLDCFYLLAGEGEYLKIFHHESKRLLYTQQVFDSQAIHGIACYTILVAEGKQALVLIWGGRSVCVLRIQIYQTTNDEFSTNIIEHVQETQLDDWILDGCFHDLVPNDSILNENRFNALLVTAHNELHRLSCNTPRVANFEAGSVTSYMTSGPRSILYSAHVICTPSSRVLVAAGTVFGEVLLWSYQGNKIHADGVGALCHKFLGHEGSVFGVRISEPQQSDFEDEGGKRVLASCSDDRTIRIWDVSECDFFLDEKEVSGVDELSREACFPNEASSTTSTGCLAMVMGHASRIWGLRFLGPKNGLWGIISHGEDGTAQVWRLNSEDLRNRSRQAKSAAFLDLEHQATYSYHSGKNIWAMTEHLEPSGVMLIATGGADGRIATYKLKCQGSDSWSSQCTMVEASRIAGLTVQSTPSITTTQSRTTTWRIFDNLQGKWRLSRTIRSKNPNYPSGVLEGTAIFESRLPLDEAFSAEYLYSEIGDFVTRNGMTMKATRKYVYRYNRDRDKITVWFVKVEDGNSVDYFFHDLKFRDLVDDRHPEATDIAFLANGHHLCNKDNYMVEYLFVSSGLVLEEWTVSFNVQGPVKDYTANATYTSECQRNTPVPGYSTTSTAHSTHSNNAGAVTAVRPRDKKPGDLNLDSFKTYAWLGEKEFLASTEQGNLLIGIMNTGRKPEDDVTTTWEHVSHQLLLRPSCIVTSIVSLGICFLTGKDGTVFLYDHSRRSVEDVYSLRRKAGFLKAQRLSEKWMGVLLGTSEHPVIGVLATYLGASEATALILYSDEGSSVLSVKNECTVRLPTNFIVTSSCFVDKEKTLVLGSRSGHLAIYGLFENWPNAAGHQQPTCFRHVHGQDAITAISVVTNDPYSAYRSCILTAGRNGSYGLHQISFDELYGFGLEMDLQTLHIGVPPFGPNIEGICIDADNLYLWGFRGTEFVVWNETEKAEVLAVDCGGAHRNWAYQHCHDGKGGGNLVYTKASVCHLLSHTQAFHQVLQLGGHGREIKTLALSPPVAQGGCGFRFLATGAEDTAIRIFKARSSVEDSNCLSIIRKHTTGLQKLRWSPDGQILFSAAGCEEFFVWRMQSAPLITVGAVCEVQCPCVTNEAFLRIMDFAVLPLQSETAGQKNAIDIEPDYLITMVYSDSSMRVFRYDPKTKSFTILFSGTYTTYCLTEVTYLHFADKIHVCTASTDGHLAFWSLPVKPVEQDTPGMVACLISTNAPSAGPITITNSKTIRVHQNSIKTMIAIPLPQHEHLIITGCDDCAVAFTRLGYQLEKLSTHSTLFIPKAHASTITAVTHLGELEAVDDCDTVKHRFASVGNDQRLKTWVVSVNLAVQGSEGVSIAKESNVSTSVADASSLDMGVESEGQKKLYVAGIGMETWRVGDADTGVGKRDS